MLFPLSWRSVGLLSQIVIKKCDKCYYRVWQVLQRATILLQSAIGTTKCDRTPLSWVTTVVASGLPQCAHIPTPTEKGDWWDWLISDQRSYLVSQMYSVNAEVFRAQNSPVNFASIPDGLPEPLVLIVSLYYIYIICLSMRSKMLGRHSSSMSATCGCFS